MGVSYTGPEEIAAVAKRLYAQHESLLARGDVRIVVGSYARHAARSGLEECASRGMRDMSVAEEQESLDYGADLVALGLGELAIANGEGPAKDAALGRIRAGMRELARSPLQDSLGTEVPCAYSCDLDAIFVNARLATLYARPGLALREGVPESLWSNGAFENGFLRALVRHDLGSLLYQRERRSALFGSPYAPASPGEGKARSPGSRDATAPIGRARMLAIHLAEDALVEAIAQPGRPICELLFRKAQEDPSYASPQLLARIGGFGSRLSSYVRRAGERAATEELMRAIDHAYIRGVLPFGLFRPPPLLPGS